MSNIDRKTTIFAPQEIADLSLQEIRRREETKDAGVSLGIPHIDAKMPALRPGQLAVIAGRPSHYKSGLAQFWARKTAKECMDVQDEAVVYVTWEMAIEELGIYDLAVAGALDATSIANGEVSKDDWVTLKNAAMKRSAIPLWYIGHSLFRRKQRERLSMKHVSEAMYWLDDQQGFKCRLLVLDYLNRIRPEPGHRQDRRIEIDEIMDTAKDMALFLGCPVIMLAQSLRRAEDRDWKLPTKNDLKESGGIEECADKILTVWFPKVDYAIGSIIEGPDGTELTVTEDLWILGLVKQKDGPGGGYFVMSVDPARNSIVPWDSRTVID